MVICFKCSSDTKSKLDYLLRSGTFLDYSDIICAAVENLAVLHDEVQNKGSVVVAVDAGPQALEIASQSNQTNNIVHGLSRQSAKATEPIVPVDSVPTAFKLASAPSEPPPQLAPLPSDVFFAGQPVPVDRWIFGQHSKLLPAKASCRALACMYPPVATGFEIDKVAARIAGEAGALGEYLAEKDRLRGMTRDDAWATGFPSGENKADRSRLRYANQFVGAIGKQGTLTGLLIDLKLVNLTQNATRRILLTRPGWDFARLENPLLDGVPADGKFTASEVMFLLEHIREHVPVEDFAFRTVLAAVQTGHDTPEKLDEICKHHVPAKRRDEITKAVITTQRTGVIARLIDLGLISRIREGVRVSYAVTDLGEQYGSRPVAA